MLHMLHTFLFFFIYSFIYLFIYSFIHLFIYSFIHLFIYSFICFVLFCLFFNYINYLNTHLLFPFLIYNSLFMIHKLNVFQIKNISIKSQKKFIYKKK